MPMRKTPGARDLRNLAIVLDRGSTTPSHKTSPVPPTTQIEVFFSHSIPSMLLAAAVGQSAKFDGCWHYFVEPASSSLSPYGYFGLNTCGKLSRPRVQPDAPLSVPPCNF